MGRIAEAAQARRAAEESQDQTAVGRLLASLDGEDRTDLLALLADAEGWPGPGLAEFITDEFPDWSIGGDAVNKWRRTKMDRYL